MASLIFLSATLFISLLFHISFKGAIIIMFFAMILFIHFSPYLNVDGVGTSSSRLSRRTKVPLSPVLKKVD
ncbi:hypothetical protein RB653_001987 [Dictyostelium firmibasis]|uniref:Uncharacterized protein n=1 Tax=Dictyostelium firmibasis TaxID=79012 RepID=A0AAN7U2C0_9MYCE